LACTNEKQELQWFLGFCNFYHHFIKDYSKIAKPLTILTGNVCYEWTEHQQLSFTTLIDAITTQPVLTLPHPTGQFRLEADSSNYTIGAVLSQLQEHKWHSIAYLSKALTEIQCNYKIYDKEMLAIMLTLKEWQHYLIGAAEPFEIWTYHQNLQYFCQPQKVKPPPSSLAHRTPTITLQTPSQTRLNAHWTWFPVEATRS